MSQPLVWRVEVDDVETDKGYLYFMVDWRHLWRGYGYLVAEGGSNAFSFKCPNLTHFCGWNHSITCVQQSHNRSVKRKFLVSRAFIKEIDGRPEEVLERRVSTHTNLVTREGLASIEQHLAAAVLAQCAAQSAGDDTALAKAARDVRYWQARRYTAQLMPEPNADGTIQFGHAVTIQRSDGRQQTFRIVGEDEADPRCGRISYVSPLARALLESQIGDTVRIGALEATIIKVE